VTGQKPFVRYWVHNGMVEYQGEKMSKSLGNLVLVRDALDTYSADALRLYMFSHHYRSPWEYRDEELDEWIRLADDIREAVDFPAYGIEQEVDVVIFSEQFFNALDDDLDTVSAINALRSIANAILEAPEEDDVREAQATLRELSEILGLSLAS
jgi:cysteinyl-tRNA synthetase